RLSVSAPSHVPFRTAGGAAAADGLRVLLVMFAALWKSTCMVGEHASSCHQRIRPQIAASASASTLILPILRRSRHAKSAGNRITDVTRQHVLPIDMTSPRLRRPR